MPHVLHNHPKLTLEGAKAVLAAAERRAVEIGVPMNIAIVDDGGFLAAFSRMDGAKLSSAQIAMTKAHSSAIRRLPTGPANDDPSMRGGLPLLVDGKCVGAIGVSNGSEEQDLDVARSGVAALVSR